MGSSGTPVSSLSTTTISSTNKSSIVVSSPILAKLVHIFASFGSFYSQQLELRPILTKSYSAGIIFGLSDYFAQKIERSNDVNGSSSKMDWTRLFVSLLVRMDLSTFTIYEFSVYTLQGFLWTSFVRSFLYLCLFCHHFSAIW